MRFHKINYDNNLSLKKNLIRFKKRLICKLFGHKHNINPKHEWCDRCGLCNEEIYGDKYDYFEIKKSIHAKYQLQEIDMLKEQSKLNQIELTRLRNNIKNMFSHN